MRLLVGKWHQFCVPLLCGLFQWSPLESTNHDTHWATTGTRQNKVVRMQSRLLGHQHTMASDAAVNSGDTTAGLPLLMLPAVPSERRSLSAQARQMACCMAYMHCLDDHHASYVA